MSLPLSVRIAWRYLRARKSHSAVGAISVVSVCGIAVATAAIICVLSVFNGFKSVIAERIDSLSPDLMVTPASGKVFADGDSLADAIAALPEVERAIPTILENALAISNGRETPISLKGADMEAYSRITALKSIIIDGTLTQSPTDSGNAPVAHDAPQSAEEESDLEEWPEEEMREGVLAVGAAARLGANPGGGVLIFTPRREGRVNLANPASSFLKDSIRVAAVYRSNQSEYDDNRVLVDLSLARDLLQYDSEASAIEVKGCPGVSSERLKAAVEAKLGQTPQASSGKESRNYIVKDRLEQQEMNFRMISIEKWVTFLLLFFILVIASFNIISSLSMLVIEKEKSMATLKALGMGRGRIASVFRWESVLVTAVGGVAGILLGLALSLLQQHFGLIRLQGDPESLTMQAYPVVVDPADLLITLIPLIVIGTVTAAVTGAFAKSRC